MSRKFEFVHGQVHAQVQVEHLAGDRFRVRVGSNSFEVAAAPQPDGGVRLVFGDGPAVSAYGAPAGNGYQVRLDGHTTPLATPQARRSGGHAGADGTVRAPMSGTVLKVQCRVGDAVTAEQTLAVLTAMKMEHKLTAGIAGIVQAVHAAEGDTVEQGAELVVVTPAE